MSKNHSYAQTDLMKQRLVAWNANKNHFQEHIPTFFPLNIFAHPIDGNFYNFRRQLLQTNWTQFRALDLEYFGARSRRIIIHTSAV